MQIVARSLKRSLLSAPKASYGPRLSVGNVIVNGQDLCEGLLCDNMLNYYVRFQLVT